MRYPGGQSLASPNWRCDGWLEALCAMLRPLSTHSPTANQPTAARRRIATIAEGALRLAPLQPLDGIGERADVAQDHPGDAEHGRRGGDVDHEQLQRQLAQEVDVDRRTAGPQRQAGAEIERDRRPGEDVDEGE